jgi:membrane glycosyltransferase
LPAGLNYWQLGESNYWGHNAIIRLAPFIKHCALPALPGREPFGGHILSHDFVEAALLRRAGWSVWLAPDLGGSYEELPPTLIDYAQRDRRWCQGNLQHVWILFARGLHGISRVHLVLGIFAYASSLLWLVSLLLGTLLAVGFVRTGLTWLPEPALADVVGGNAAWQAGSLAIFTFTLLFVPKILAVMDLRRLPGGLGTFGGAGRVWPGILLESLLSMLLAPVLMLFHANFVIATLFGRGVRWVSQRREGLTGWREALATHAGHTAAGLAWLALLAVHAPGLLPWMAPVLLGLVLSIFFSQLTSRESLGRGAARQGWLCTPEELAPDRELRELEATLQQPPADLFPAAAGPGFVRAVIDPGANALHCSLQRTRRQSPATRQSRQALEERVLREGPAALKPKEKNSLLADPEAMMRLHHAVWTRPSDELAPPWRDALAQCEVPATVLEPAEAVSQSSESGETRISPRVKSAPLVRQLGDDESASSTFAA